MPSTGRIRETTLLVSEHSVGRHPSIHNYDTNTKYEQRVLTGGVISHAYMHYPTALPTPTLPAWLQTGAPTETDRGHLPTGVFVFVIVLLCQTPPALLTIR